MVRFTLFVSTQLYLTLCDFKQPYTTKLTCEYQAGGLKMVLRYFVPDGKHTHKESASDTRDHDIRAVGFCYALCRHTCQTLFVDVRFHPMTQ